MTNTQGYNKDAHEDWQTLFRTMSASYHAGGAAHKTTHPLRFNSSLTKLPSSDRSASWLEGILTGVPEHADCIRSARENALPGETDDVDQT